MIRRTLLLLFVLLAAAVVSMAADPPLGNRNGQPIDITSDRLEADDAARKVRFLGQVVARQGDVTLYAREMLVILQEKAQEIDRIEAYGDVRIVQGERVATAQKGVYLNREGQIVLSGSPQVHQGKDVVTGEEIIVYLNEDRSEVKGRVKATFRPKGEKP